MATGQFEVPRIQDARALIGEKGANLKALERATGASISARGTRLIVSGEQDAVELARRALESLLDSIGSGLPVGLRDVHGVVEMLRTDSGQRVLDVLGDTIPIATATHPVAPKSLGQKRYLDAIRSHTITFGLGPAGTGKTYLAVAMAVSSLLNRDCRRVILARPAVEAGERLGFLPGDIAQKVSPYLRPLYDSLEDLVDVERVRRFEERGVIEIAPLAFMRGRTLNDAFVILDEGQNSTPEQMKMFLTRLGFNSKAVITGDITQMDLAPGKPSGLVHAVGLLEGVDDIAVCRLDRSDVVRHPLVAMIVDAYGREKQRDQEK
jgi:phosphate starvation-inducible PhoH-like protein